MSVPDTLFAKITADLRPVRPVWSHPVRAAAVVVLAALAGTSLVMALGLRADLGPLGTPSFVGVVAVRLLAGALLIWLALREAVPTGRTSEVGSRGAVVLGVLLFLAFPFVFAGMYDVPPAGTTVGPWICVPRILGVAVPAFVALLWFLSSAYPLHPLRTSALAALGSGILAEAAQFVTCPNADPLHSMLCHGGAVLALAVAGVLGGWRMASRRRQELSL